MIKNIIFDLGNVVIGRDFNRFGEKVSSIFSFFSGFDFPECWKEFDRGTLTKQEVAIELAKLNNCTIEESTKAINMVKDLMTEISETVELIKKLKKMGKKVYVLSNMPEEFYEQIEKQPVMKEFDGKVISYQEHLIKPDPRIFRLILERYGLKAEESLFVDDKKKNVDTAEELGIKGLLFTSPTEGCKRIMSIITAG